MARTGLTSLLFVTSLFFASAPIGTLASPSPDGIGNIPASILDLLLSPGIQVSQINVALTVPDLLLNTGSANLQATSPVPLVEVTIDQLAADIGINGTTFFSFNQTFTNFVLPGLSSVNSGNIPDVTLTQGGLETLNVLSATELDIISATYSIRVLTINGTGGIPLTLPASEVDIPTDITLNLV